MTGISSLLQDAYAPTKTASAEDLEKEACLQYFGSLCEKEGIDVDRLSEPQLLQLYKTAMELKKAEEESPKEEKKEEGGKKVPPPFAAHEKGESKEKEEKEEGGKKEAAIIQAANDEWTQKQAAVEAWKQADAAGRVMADSFIDQMQKRAAAGENGEAAREVIAQMKMASAGPQPSDTPNIDYVAGNLAIDMLKEAGYDPDHVVEVVNAVYTLGLPASTKLASVGSMDDAVRTRALEICELAGATVNWEQ